MAPRPDVTAFDSFDSHDCSARNLCIYYLVTQGRKCNNRISAVDLGAARSLRERVKGSRDNTDDLLQQYATLKCCKGVHRRELASNGLAAALAKRWRVEILAESNDRSSQANALTDHESVVPQADNSHSVSQQARSRDQQTRYNLRSRTNTRETLDATYLSGVDDNGSSSFRPRKQHVDRDVTTKLMQQLSSKSNASGALYLYTRSSTPGFVKIGHTTGSVEERHRRIARACGYKPLLLYSLQNVPHVYHVEQLVHCELSECWRAQEICRCGCRHREWFEISAENAAAVARQWAAWMEEARPYDRDGILTIVWRDRLRQLKAEGKSVTGKLMLEQHRTRQTSHALSQDIRIDDLTNHAGQTNTPIDFALIVLMVQIVLAAMDQLQTQRALESNLHTFRPSTRTATLASSMSLPARQLVRRDTNRCVLSQA